ncbi:hypothetical protein HHK36_002000 [Tetracentron sinense]|uniref:Uncharacterized protein n=1 Tax=Tetracentron sinense TaxID=13715 RepID=A0A835DVK1_TETSI|nr:hypothetical protein HHK36_002000 [Tetracentron sinense]
MFPFTREGVFPQIKITPRVDRRVVTAEEEASPHQSNRRAASDNRKSWSLSPEKEDRFYTTRGSLGFDQVHPKKVVSDCVKHWFQDTLKEAIADDSSMQDLVGQMYYSGYGVPRDAQKGRAWFARASRSRSSVWKVSDKHPAYQLMITIHNPALSLAAPPINLIVDLHQASSLAINPSSSRSHEAPRINLVVDLNLTPQPMEHESPPTVAATSIEAPPITVAAPSLADPINAHPMLT